jgi:sulfur carrier protein ThiS
MRMRTKLYGTLSQQFPDYRHSQGVEVEIPDGTSVKDLFARSKISENQGAVVVMEGRTLKADDTIRRGALVNVVQANHGG